MQQLLSYSRVNDDEWQKLPWEGIPLSLPQSAIEFLGGLSASLFRSGASKSELGSSQSCPMPEDGNLPQGCLKKASLETLNSGVKMKTVVSEDVSLETEVFPDVVENKERSLFEKRNDEKFKQFDMVNDCSDHFFRDQAGKELGSSQV